MKKGAQYELLFEAYFKGLGKAGYLYRIADLSDLRGISGKGSQVKANPVPADYLVIHPHNGFHYAEVKGTENATSFSFSLIRPSQMNHARRATTARKGSYWFYIFSTSLIQWYRVPAEVILSETTKKSLTWAELSPCIWNM